MRWKHDRLKSYDGVWQRRFALFPIRIEDAGITVWFEPYEYRWILTDDNWAGATYKNEWRLP